MIRPISFSSKYEKEQFEPIKIEEKIIEINKKDYISKIDEPIISSKELAAAQRAQVRIEESHRGFFEEVSALVDKIYTGNLDETDFSAISKARMRLAKIAEKALIASNHELYLKANRTLDTLSNALVEYFASKIEYKHSARFVEDELRTRKIEKQPTEFLEVYDRKTGKFVSVPIK